LRRTSPDQPGWTRRAAGRGFVYLDEHGDRLSAEDAQRAKDLVIPPAWKDVWISPYPNGHLQAVGTDDAGRRQYLYHPFWVEQRNAAKHDRVLKFGKRLPKVRERLREDLGTEELSQAQACAVAVKMLDLGCFRIGNDVYAEEYGSFGLTTLERRHVRREGDVLVFEFTGKSGIDHHVEIADPTVIEAIERMRRRRTSKDPSLLVFRNGRGWRSLTPQDVNGYVREVSGMDATAKDFRTWHGTVLAAAALGASAERATTKTARKRAVAAAMREVSDFLGNTPALARSAYVDPRVIDAFEEGKTIAPALRRAKGSPEEKQLVLERATLRLIQAS
jgi:DNA topoisomerase IB